MIKKKVVGMLYLLLRDELPFGRLAQLLRQNVVPITEDTTYTNKILLNLAEDLYQRFIEK
jgi:hypothetical protein